MLNRSISLEEKKAYKNLKNYDQGLYSPKPPSEDYKKISFDTFTSNNQYLNIDNKLLSDYLTYGQVINTKHSNFHPGQYANKNDYEASFSKRCYFSSELEFIIELFISHHNIHAFEDGNKRTALNYFLDLLYKYTRYTIQNILRIQDAQIYYLTNKITKDEFIQIILSEVHAKMIKKNMKCQLEHLIPRVEIDEDLGTNNSVQVDRRSSFTLSDLEKSQFFYQQLKKPYFQRDTNEWTVERVEKLIDTFLDDGLIPAIILWENNEGDILIIDGAHRISSLAAWVNDDYGNISVSSTNKHHELSEYFNIYIGNYANIKTSSNQKYKSIKQIIAKKSIPVQWVTGDYDKVKESFIRINEQGVTLSNDEKELIQNDKLPSSKLSRAILSHGTGQKSKYQTPNTFDIYTFFFLPTLIRDITVYPMLGATDEEFVISKVYNVIKIIDDANGFSIEELEEQTLGFCKFIQEFLQISNKVYFYGANQHYKTSSLFGFTLFARKMMQDKNLLSKYIKNRNLFENYLVENEKFVQTISRKRRQSSKSYIDISDYYLSVLEAIETENLDYVFEKFPYLPKTNSKLTDRQKNINKKYNEFLAKIPKCSICNAYIDGSKDEKLTHNCCKLY